MKVSLLGLVAFIFVVGCSSSSAPDIQATIEAGVRATRVAENDAKIATNVQKAIDATLTAPPPTSTLRPFDHNIDKYYNEGVHYTEQGWWKESIEKFDKAIELDPNFAMAYNNRGNAYYTLEQYQRAIEDYDKAIELDPTDALTYNNRGVSYNKLGQYQQAISDYDKAIELDPTDANT